MTCSRVIMVVCMLFCGAACGSQLIIVGADAAFDAANETSVDDGSIDIIDVSDATADTSWWFSQFDASGFDGFDPPRVGEYPPPSGKRNGGCWPLAASGSASGWCCSGVWKAQGCVCGNSWGCLPPYLCCNLPDHFVPECVPGLNACPNYNTPWNPGGYPPDGGGG